MVPTTAPVSGTCLDTPAHRFGNGHDLAGLPLESCALPVGIGWVYIDDMTTGQRAAHTVLLGAGIPIVEHLTGLDEAARPRVRSSRPVSGRTRIGHLPGSHRRKRT
jgi:kynurenine formamidase